ncbi:SDR family NAD(P)-dependent oxidoreductase [Sciscionella marina]|uniref:SDR family NAD(P)-dependent oxidoreductase n=1 Tax=Sciscionella marina TaxID=508770 RepID=UPI00039A3B7C|nr:SDR family NAD(P)-dependent oxidoreductase [Sciscionella marina]
MNIAAGALEAKTALVTGAAGAIGQAVAESLASAGARVVLADRDEAGARSAADALRADRLDAVSCGFDQADPASIQRLFTDTIGDRLDICVANAGYGRVAGILDQDLTDWRRHVDVNLTGTFLVVQAAARRMAAHGSGAIVLNASSAAVHSTPMFGAYAATKAGVEMLARCMADELGPLGIRVNTVCPGVVETGMTTSLLNVAGGQMRQIMEHNTPTGAIGRPQQIARVITFLASEEADYVTGAALLVDGGQTLRGFPRWFTANTSGDAENTWKLITEDTR